MASITNRSTVTLSAAITAAIMTVSAVLWLNSRFGEIEDELDDIQSSAAEGAADTRLELAELRHQVDEVGNNIQRLHDRSNGFVTSEKLSAWIELLRASNPEVSIPDPPR